MDRQQAKREARLFCAYLIHEKPPRAVIDRYVAFVAPLPKLSPQETALLDLAFRFPVLTKYLDAGLRIVRPDSEIRHRLYVMFAILEAEPKYAGHFMAVQRSLWYLAVVMYAGFRAVFRAFFGVVLVSMVRK